MNFEITLKDMRDLAKLNNTFSEIVQKRYNHMKETDTFTVSSEKIDDVARECLKAWAAENRKRSILKTIKSMEDFAAGEFNVKFSTLENAPKHFEQYLKKDMIDGWIYVADKHGYLRAELVDTIRVESTTPGYHQKSDTTYHIVLKTHFTALADKGFTTQANRYTFDYADINGKTPEQALHAAGIVKETPRLKAQYIDQLNKLTSVIKPQFAEQFRVTGKMTESYNTLNVINRKVINDVEETHYKDLIRFGSNFLDEDGDFEIPVYPQVKVFDLHLNEFCRAHAEDMTPYVYDEALYDKLILPSSHRDLLDVMTTDLTSYTGDIVEGKGTGNVILCKGIPGVGKTLTAETYSEFKKRPLYKVHSGNLGISAEHVGKQLSVILGRANRWNAVLLLDEADVFVSLRGDDLVKNAIVAEFLRTLEYSTALLFLTTNRVDDIDDAILSRCIAVIDVVAPEYDDATRLWKILSKQLGEELSDDLIAKLVTAFPEATGRDVKMLCSTVFRMHKAGKYQLDVDSFRRAASYRGVKIKGEGNRHVSGVKDPDLEKAILTIQDSLEAKLGFRPTAQQSLEYLAKSA